MTCGKQNMHFDKWRVIHTQFVETGLTPYKPLILSPVTTVTVDVLAPTKLLICLKKKQSEKGVTHLNNKKKRLAFYMFYNQVVKHQNYTKMHIANAKTNGST